MFACSLFICFYFVYLFICSNTHSHFRKSDFVVSKAKTKSLVEHWTPCADGAQLDHLTEWKAEVFSLSLLKSAKLFGKGFHRDLDRNYSNRLRSMLLRNASVSQHWDCFCFLISPLQKQIPSSFDYKLLIHTYIYILTTPSNTMGCG